MASIRRSSFRKSLHHAMRRLFALLPVALRFALYRLMVECDPKPNSRLELKIADTKEELEACFKILHDAYVSSGFMKPDPSGMRVTVYHALPTTTTLCAKVDGKVAGTISMIREGVFGFPLQSIFELGNVRTKGGNIAEISALAVHPDYRKTGGAILFPLMKFMREYCVEYFDTRHLVIAVNPEKIEMYEALLFFDRLQEKAVDQYDFANGAPAVGATLDLKFAAELFKSGYKGRVARKSLYEYFFKLKLQNIKWPARRYFTTNDPVMTPELLNHFFNEKTKVFEQLDDRRKALLWSIYDMVEYRGVLPMMRGVDVSSHPLRQHQRFSISCPGTIEFCLDGAVQSFVVSVMEISQLGFQVECALDMPINSMGNAKIELGYGEVARIKAHAVRKKESEFANYFGFRIDEADTAWLRCVASLEVGITAADLMQ